MTTEATTGDIVLDARKQRIEQLGCIITPRSKDSFERFVGEIRLDGIFNVTDWTPAAVHTLLSVYRDNKWQLAIRVGEKYFTPILFDSGPAFDKMVELITTGRI